jgi:hypothetical protein
MATRGEIIGHRIKERRRKITVRAHTRFAPQSEPKRGPEKPYEDDWWGRELHPTHKSLKIE